MISKDIIKTRLNLDITDTSKDTEIEFVINIVQEHIKNITNNPNLDFSTSSLDYVVLYFCLKELNPETNLRAGKTSSSVGVSYSFETELPNEIKLALKPFYINKKVRFLT